MKTRYSVIWIKAVALISVLLMNVCRADLSLSEVESTLNFEIATSGSPVKINPEGPLNFLRGYIYQKMECMYNKRFFSPEINTYYFVKEDITATQAEPIYKYNRTQQKDKAYTALPENKMDVYAERYHNHLIDLFPSPTGDVTLETRGNQSFVQFLRAETTEKHSLQILAMLLLFSEGVSIPIDFNNKKLNVYEKDKKDKIHFEVEMVIPWFNREENETKRFEQKKVKQMIKFFQEYAIDPEVLSLMEEKCSQEEIATGTFLDSPKFLIQSYIFGFIDTAERATEFIQTVHEMTEKYAPKTEAQSKNDSVYGRLFKPARTITGTDCIALMKKTQEILSMHQTFPFTNSKQLPAYKSIHYYNRETNAFSTKYLETYSNCVECVILSLFCCLAYDPVEGIYETDHMGNVSPSLKEFFSPKNQPFDMTKVEFQRNWCRVVADLGEPSIAYCKERNEIDCGILNMLIVIAEVINAPEEEKKKILGFAQSLKEQKGVLKNELSNAIQEYTNALFKRLSKTKSLIVELSDLKGDKYANERYDISGDISITFENNTIKNTIVLTTAPRHSFIKMPPVITKVSNFQMEKMNEIADSCKNETIFIENLFVLYVDYEIRKIHTSEENEEFLKDEVQITIKNNFTDINRLLLVNNISELSYKSLLVTVSIIYTMNQNLCPSHPLIRLTSNILGSTELNNIEIQKEMLPPIVFAGLHNKSGSNSNYPNIKLSENQYNHVASSSFAALFIDYILDCDMAVFIKWIKFYIDNLYAQRDMNYNPLLDPSMNIMICQYIFKDGTMKHSDTIDGFMIQKHAKKEDEALSIIHFIWATYLCVEKRPNIELIKKNLDAIRENSFISSECTNYIESRAIIKRAIKKLNNMKDKLYINEDFVSKFSWFIKTLTSITS
ncbi:hypothetical protein NEAUS07_0550 [Nematocida ausubeli]|nr:hypothetical protein NEAUS07_0550 [Nematocida ausubeli]